TSSDSQAIFTPTTYTFTTGDAGVHSFAGILKTSGSQSITATDSFNGFVGTQSGLEGQAAAAASLTLAGLPNTTTAGVPHSFTLTARDIFGNIATGYAGTVAFTSTDPQAVFAPLSYTFTTADAGVHNFSATLKTFGTQSITATDSFNGLTVTQPNIFVLSGAATALVVSGFPTSTTAGVAQAFTVTARDPFGNTATGSPGPGTLTSSDPQALFTPTTFTFSTMDGGVHAFSGTLRTVGTQSITAIDSANSLIASQTGISVNASAATSLVVSGFINTTAGVAQPFTVPARDAFGNTATGYPVTITLTTSHPPSSFPP